MIETLLENELTPALLEVMADMIGGAVTLASAPFGRILYTAGALNTPGSGSSVGVSSTDYAQHFEVYTQAGEIARNADLPLVRAIRLGQPVLDEAWVLGGSTGPRTPVIIDAYPLKNAAGRVVGGIVMTTDGSRWAKRSEQLKVSIKIRDMMARGLLKV